MNLLEYVNAEDIKNFLSHWDEFKNQSHLVVVPSYDNKQVFVIWKDNIRFIFEIVSDEEILINGEHSLEFSFYWQAFLFRLFGDAYREYVYTKVKNDLLTNTVTISPFGLPEGVDVNKFLEDAITPVFNILKPRLNREMAEVEAEALKIWPNVELKDIPLIRKRLDNNK